MTWRNRDKYVPRAASRLPSSLRRSLSSAYCFIVFSCPALWNRRAWRHMDQRLFFLNYTHAFIIMYDYNNDRSEITSYIHACHVLYPGWQQGHHACMHVGFCDNPFLFSGRVDTHFCQRQCYWQKWWQWLKWGPMRPLLLPIQGIVYVHQNKVFVRMDRFWYRVGSILTAKNLV